MFKKKKKCFVFQLDTNNFDEKHREEIFNKLKNENKIELVDYIINFGSGLTTFLFSELTGKEITPTMYRVYAFSKTGNPEFKYKTEKINFKDTIIYKFEIEN